MATTNANKIVLITGASRGLGRNMALHLADKGWGIVLTYHSNSDAAEEVTRAIADKGGKAICLQLDVARVDTFSAFADSLGQALRSTWNRDRFDCLINNAGTGVFKPFAETTQADFDRMVNEHAKAPFFLSQALLPLLRDGGRIWNVSSGLTRMAFAGFSAYAMMKSATETLSLYLAKELGARGIAVNTIAPGAIETDFGHGYVRDTPEVNKHIADLTALGRVGLPDDIGGAVAALLDTDAGWINAQRIEVSGGQNI